MHTFVAFLFLSLCSSSVVALPGGKNEHQVQRRQDLNSDSASITPSAETSANSSVPVTTQIIIPVATICPANVTVSPSTSAGLGLSSYVLTMNTESTSVSSTATGNSTGTTVTETDTNGCSTLYTPVTTPVCQTTLSGMGQLPITVTACSQYVTFSTSTSTEIPVSTVSGSPMGANVAYFLADWRVIASGVVPNNVTVEDCVQGSGGQDCSTSTESWSVTTETYDVPFTSTITFEGMVTGPAILALGNGLYTTTIDASITQPLSINTVIITATPSPRPSIVRIGGVTTTVTIRSTVTSTVEVVNAYTPGPSTVASVQTAASVNTSAVV